MPLLPNRDVAEPDAEPTSTSPHHGRVQEDEINAAAVQPDTHTDVQPGTSSATTSHGSINIHNPSYTIYNTQYIIPLFPNDVAAFDVHSEAPSTSTLKTKILSLLLGQVASGLLVGTTICLDELRDRGWCGHATLQSSMLYVLLFLVYGCLLIVGLLGMRGGKNGECRTDCKTDEVVEGKMDGDKSDGVVKTEGENDTTNVTGNNIDVIDLESGSFESGSRDSGPSSSEQTSSEPSSSSSPSSPPPTSSPTSSPSSPLKNLFHPLLLTLLLLFALFDVEGNALVCLGFSWGRCSAAVLTLAGSCNIPAVMLLSWLILKTEYHRWHLFGCILCIMGQLVSAFGELAVKAVNEGGEKTSGGEGDEGGSSEVRADWRDICVVLLGGACYASANVLQEKLVTVEEGVGDEVGDGVEGEGGVVQGEGDVVHGEGVVEEGKSIVKEGEGKTHKSGERGTEQRDSVSAGESKIVTGTMKTKPAGTTDITMPVSTTGGSPATSVIAAATTTTTATTTQTATTTISESIPNDTQIEARSGIPESTLKIFHTLCLLGLFGTLISFAQMFIFEPKSRNLLLGKSVQLEFDDNTPAEKLPSILTVKLISLPSDHPEIFRFLCLYLGFLFSMYSLTAFLLQTADVVLFNLSLLSMDFYMLPYNCMVKKEKLPTLFFLALALVITGVCVYETADWVRDKVDGVRRWCGKRGLCCGVCEIRGRGNGRRGNGRKDEGNGCSDDGGKRSMSGLGRNSSFGGNNVGGKGEGVNESKEMRAVNNRDNQKEKRKRSQSEASLIEPLLTGEEEGVLCSAAFGGNGGVGDGGHGKLDGKRDAKIVS